MVKRWIFAAASAVIVLTMVVAFTLGAPTSPPVLQTCGGAIMPNGKCGGLPGPGEPGATCVPVPDGPYHPCVWFWETPYPRH